MKKIMILGGLLAAVIAAGILFLVPFRPNAAPKPAARSVATVSSPATRPAVARPKITADNAPPPNPAVIDGVKMTYDPFKPSDGPYPDLAPGEKIWIDASIDQQLIYLFHGSTRLYTMATSSGMESVPGDASPLGVYHIQKQRGTWFYVPRYHEGAKYWVSWKGHGIYLFHSVPMNHRRQLLPHIAAQLLQEASHGCFHLTVADARWFYQHVPYGSTVVVERAPVLLQANRLYQPTPAQRQAIAATQPAATAYGARSADSQS